MQDLASGTDTLVVSDISSFFTDTMTLKADARHVTKNYTPPVPATLGFGSNNVPKQYIELERNVHFNDVKTQNLAMMPGFKFSWYYTSIEDMELDSEPRHGRYHQDDAISKAFVR